MTSTYEWAQIVLTALNLGAVAVLFFVGRLAASKKTLADLDRRVMMIEEGLKNAPSWSLLNDLREKLSEIEGELKGISAKMDAGRENQAGLTARLVRIEDHLLGREI
jgi:hypothetical protein